MIRGIHPRTRRFTATETDGVFRAPLMTQTHDGRHGFRHGSDLRWCGVHRVSYLSHFGGRNGRYNAHYYATFGVRRPVEVWASTANYPYIERLFRGNPLSRGYFFLYFIRWEIPPLHAAGIGQPAVSFIGTLHTITVSDPGKATAIANALQTAPATLGALVSIFESNGVPLNSHIFYLQYQPVGHTLRRRVVISNQNACLYFDREAADAWTRTWLSGDWSNPLPKAGACLLEHAGVSITVRERTTSSNNTGKVLWCKEYLPANFDPNSDQFWVDSEGDLVPFVPYEIVLYWNGSSYSRVDFVLPYVDWTSTAFRAAAPLGKRQGQNWEDAVDFASADARINAYAERAAKRLIQFLTDAPAGGFPNKTTGYPPECAPFTPSGNPKAEFARSTSFTLNPDTQLLGAQSYSGTQDTALIRTVYRPNGDIDWTLFGERYAGILFDNHGTILSYYPYRPLYAPSAVEPQRTILHDRMYQQALWMAHCAKLWARITQELQTRVGITPKWEANCFSVPELAYLFYYASSTNLRWHPNRPATFLSDSRQYINSGTTLTDWLGSLRARAAHEYFQQLACVTYENSPFLYADDIADQMGGPTDAAAVTLHQQLLTHNRHLQSGWWQTLFTNNYWARTRLLVQMGKSVPWRFADLHCRNNRKGRQIRQYLAANRIGLTLYNAIVDGLPLPTFAASLSPLIGATPSDTNWINAWLAVYPNLAQTTTQGWRPYLYPEVHCMGLNRYLYMRTNQWSTHAWSTRGYTAPFNSVHPYNPNYLQIAQAESPNP